MQQAAPSWRELVRCYSIHKKNERTEVGLHINFVNCLVILGALRICSSLHPSRN